MLRRTGFAALFIVLAGATSRGEEAKDWKILFNGKDTTGWKLRADKLNVTNFVDAEGKPLADARIVKKDGRDVVVDKGGKEIKGAKGVTESVANPSGWIVEKGELVCIKPHHDNDLLTEEKFTDFALHVEFQATSNSGVYLQGRYEIQIIDSFGVKPKVVEKEGKKIETLDSHQCGALYGKIAPSKNMAKPPMEWQSYDVVFHGAKTSADGKVLKKARVTLVWNGEKVFDDGETDGVTGAALDNKVGEPGPVLLQGDHGKVTFRNIKIKPLTGEK